MNFKIKSLILILLLLIIGISSVSASEIDNNNVTLSENIPTIQSDDSYQNDILTGDLDDFQEEDDNYNHQDNVLKSTDSQESLHEDDSDVITVNNWDELQYYCSLKDEDYHEFYLPYSSYLNVALLCISSNILAFTFKPKLDKKILLIESL